MEDCLICLDSLNGDTVTLTCCNKIIHTSCWESWPFLMCPHCRDTANYIAAPITEVQRFKNYAYQIWNQLEVDAFNSFVDMKTFPPRVWVRIVYLDEYIDAERLDRVVDHFKGYCRRNKSYWRQTPATLEELQEGTWYSLLYGFDLLEELDE